MQSILESSRSAGNTTFKVKIGTRLNVEMSGHRSSTFIGIELKQGMKMSLGTVFIDKKFYKKSSKSQPIELVHSSL